MIFLFGTIPFIGRRKGIYWIRATDETPKNAPKIIDPAKKSCTTKILS